jgi:hypothetical protein
VALTAAHWVYLAGVLLIIGVTVARKNVVVPALLATLVTAWVMTGSPVTGMSNCQELWIKIVKRRLPRVARRVGR